MIRHGIWLLEALAFSIVIKLLRLLPIDQASSLGGRIARRLGPLTPSQKVIDSNISLAFPDLNPRDRARLISEQWDNLGRTFFEFPLMPYLRLDKERIIIENAERLEDIRRSKEPVVFVSGHFANWEIMPCVIAASGIACHMTYRPTNNPYVDKIVKSIRSGYGVRLFAPKGSDGSREMLEALQRGESVALMNDQKFNQGLALPFMGHLAHTAAGPTRLALRFGAVLQPMSVERLPKARFRVVVHPPIRITKSESREADVISGVTQINDFIAAQIRKYPEQWFWAHRRWAKSAYQSALPEQQEKQG